MKTAGFTFLFSLVLMAFSPLFSQDANQAQSPPAANSTPTTTSLFPFRPLDQLVGQRFVFRPMMTAKQQQTGYLGFDFDYNPDYREYLGRSIKILSIGGSKYFPKIQVAVEDNLKEFTIITEGGSMNAFVFIPDVEAAKAQWTNATLWYKGDNLICCYQEDADSLALVKVKKLSQVKVVDVGVSWDPTRPIRFTVQTTAGQQGFVDVNVSGTNVSRAVRGQNRFDDLFFSQDPRTLFAWPDSIWSAIRSGNVIVGMTPEQAKMAWGTPKSTGSDGPDREAWTYASGNTVHFENGVVTGIDAPRTDDAVTPDGYPKPDP